MKEKLRQILKSLEEAHLLLANKKVTAGFDGCIDSVVKVIEYKTEDGKPQYFELIEQFGNYIANKKGGGFSLETEEMLQKIGGNMPIMANAMGRLGVNVNCVGAFGIPAIALAFKVMDSRCTLHSYCNPGFTTAMEFFDGKFMLAEMKDLNNSDWGTIKKVIGLATLKEVFLTSQLICLLNWSEVFGSGEIWEGLLEEILISAHDDQLKKHFFFDLSDCSARSLSDIHNAVTLIKKFNTIGTVTLSLNTNEASIIYKTVLSKPVPKSIDTIGINLFTVLNINTLIIHSSKMSQLWDTSGTYSNQPDLISNPRISTGAGDNFNAGFCIGTMIGLQPGSSLILANIVSNIYMLDGESPDLNTLKNHVANLLIPDKTKG